ncbi:MAG: hypothetical protein V2I57_06530, partial [Xanthomonadales bacterium]|nr:hypothetical protein [Xanthomonadales bacterium]
EPEEPEEPEESAPKAPEITDPVFLAAREAFERELLAGHFSKLDVFVAYEQAMKQPGATEIPRSEFFHRVVNEALATRDTFEAMLTDKDREQFVDIHSRYLDEVTDETDLEARERLHREHQEKLAGLQPRESEVIAAD